jgi:ribosome biogenesis GTPase A
MPSKAKKKKAAMKAKRGKLPAYLAAMQADEKREATAAKKEARDLARMQARERGEEPEQAPGGEGESEQEKEAVHPTGYQIVMEIKRVNRAADTKMHSSNGIARMKMVTKFTRESKEAVLARISASQKPLTRAGDCEGLPFATDFFSDPRLAIPMRPAWTKGTTKTQLDRQESRYFDDWLIKLYDNFPPHQCTLNHFEHNLEVWRQLWRVCERSDCVVVCCDARNPIFGFPSSLCTYVTGNLRTPLIVMLTKVDLVPKTHIDLWVAWFAEHRPEVHVCVGSTKPTEQVFGEQKATDTDNHHNNHYHSAEGKNEDKKEQRWTIRKVDYRKGRRLKEAYGVEALEGTIRRVLREKTAVDDRLVSEFSLLSDALRKEGWNSTKAAQDEGRTLPVVREEEEEEEDDDDKEDDNASYHDGRVRQGELEEESAFVTVGFVGVPNAGKSSLINSICKKKLLSVSASPGHTKHLQTLFVNSLVRLCDCPGLVFPAATMPRSLQALLGIYPVAQMREPYSGVAYLAERLEIEKSYDLLPWVRPLMHYQEDGDMRAAKLHRGDPPSEWVWSGYNIAECYALKRGFRTKKGNLDTYRAGKEIVTDCLRGHLRLFFKPPPPLTDTQAQARE